MQHMVIFRTSDGKPGYHQADDLEAAVKRVEQLRNVDQVTDVRIFQMQEVPIEFKTYYRVEVAPGTGGGAAPAGGRDEPARAMAGPTGDPGPTAVSAANRFGLFGRT
jgi:hypothetical protein